MATRPAQLRQFLSKAELLFQISLTHTNSKRSVRYDMTHFKTTPVILNKSLRTLSWRSDQQYQTRPQCTVFRVCFGCVQCVCVCVCMYHGHAAQLNRRLTWRQHHHIDDGSHDNRGSRRLDGGFGRRVDGELERQWSIHQCRVLPRVHKENRKSGWCYTLKSLTLLTC